MKELKLTNELIALPVTDIRHVIEEINKHRKTQEAVRLYFKKKALYQQEHQKVKINKNTVQIFNKKDYGNDI